MSRIQAASVVAAVTILGAAGVLGAQTKERPPGEAVSEAAAVPADEVSRRCLELPLSGEPFGLEGRLASESCEVTEVGSLIRVGSVAWHWALYRRELVYEAGTGARPEDLRFFPDTVREDELVLFVEAAGEAAGGKAVDPADGSIALRPVWHDRSDTSFEVIEAPRAAAVPAGAGWGALFAHRRCVSGTGGCRDHPYRLSPDATVEAIEPAYMTELVERLPEGWGTWKGVWLEPEGPRTEAGVYVPGDANCCPSFRASASLAFAGDRLSLDSLALAPEEGSFAWEIVPGRSFGHVDAETSEAELVSLYGAGAIERAEVYLSEGVCTPGTRVFPDAPWQIEVAWADSAHSRPAFVRASGTEGPWRTPTGVRPGTTLAELEAMSGEPISFYGFEWDYGGAASWEEEGETVYLTVRPDAASYRRLHGDGDLVRDLRSEELFGDRLVRSDHPVVRQITIQVEEMSVGWARPAIERDCESLEGAAGNRGAG